MSLLLNLVLLKHLKWFVHVQTISKSMAGIVKAMDTAMASNNLERVAQTMDQFERQFENLDIQSEFVNDAMNNQASLSTPEDQVSSLMQEVADEHGLDVQLNMPQAGLLPVAGQQQATSSGDAEINSRLQQLRGAAR